MQGEAADNDKVLFAITYQGTQISLGRTWEEIIATVDTFQFDRKIAASLKLNLYEKLKDRLKINPHQEKKIFD